MPIGGWRDEYAKKVPIDVTGKLPDGDTFSTVSEFRELLVDRQDQFNRCLTQQTDDLRTGPRTGDRRSPRGRPDSQRT